MGAQASTIGAHHAARPALHDDFDADANSFRYALRKLQMELNPQLSDLNGALQSPTKRRRHAYDDLCTHEHQEHFDGPDDVEIEECDEAHHRHRQQMNIEDLYEMGKELGSGGQAIVRLCWEKPGSAVFGPTVRIFACKSPLSSSDRRIWNRAVQQQADILLHLRGVDGLVHLEKVLEDKQGMKHMLFPYCESGDLLAMLEDRSAQPDAALLSEREASIIFKKLAQTLSECHHRRIIHRDIKLDNVFVNAHGYATSYEKLDLRLGDFGHAVRLRPCQLSIPPGQPHVGTNEYMAPEIVARVAYDHRADIWSLGVLLYALLTSKLPFIASRNPDHDIFYAILTEELPFQDGSYLPILSLEAKDLLNGMLRKDPRERLSLQEALEHPWVQGHTTPQIGIQQVLPNSNFNHPITRGSWTVSNCEDGSSSSCDLELGDQSEIDLLMHQQVHAANAEESSAVAAVDESDCNIDYGEEEYYFVQMSEALVPNHVHAIRAL